MVNNMMPNVCICTSHTFGYRDVPGVEFCNSLTVLYRQTDSRPPACALCLDDTASHWSPGCQNCNGYKNGICNNFNQDSFFFTTESINAFNSSRANAMYFTFLLMV